MKYTYWLALIALCGCGRWREEQKPGCCGYARPSSQIRAILGEYENEYGLIRLQDGGGGKYANVTFFWGGATFDTAYVYLPNVKALTANRYDTTTRAYVLAMDYASGGGLEVVGDTLWVVEYTNMDRIRQFVKIDSIYKYPFVRRRD